MPRRKQDCPKRMKWEGGEEGPPSDQLNTTDKEQTEGDDESRSNSPQSDISGAAADDEAAPSPASGDETHTYRESSRCNSRDSSGTESNTQLPQSPSQDSHAFDRPPPVGMLGAAALSPVGISLPPTLPAAAAAALLPPQSAAMAAYLAAAQSHGLLIPPTFPRAPISPLVTSSSSSPPTSYLPTNASSLLNSSPPASMSLVPNNISPPILDLSRLKRESDSDCDLATMNAMRHSVTPPAPPLSGNTTAPLDLSVSSRKRSSENNIPSPTSRGSKLSRTSTPTAPPIPQPWPSHLPYFAAAAAAADLWNGKLKSSGVHDATKALEKMSQLSKLGGEDLVSASLYRTTTNPLQPPPPPPPAAPSQSNATVPNRHSAWQSHWLNKGAEQAKDVLKCVWCKQSFPSLAAMTTHMKEAKHCGVNVPVPLNPNLSPALLPPVPPSAQISSPSNTSSNSSSTTSSSMKQHPSDLNLLIKETMPLPRKLVRGQDVWLGKGAEQTRQILKCMWCGQSFRSLAEMTAHMQQTQHYTNIISQEQIISWRSSDDTKNSTSSSSSTSNNHTSHSTPNTNHSSGHAPHPPIVNPPGPPSSHVSAVLTCKVCDQAFSSLKELSNHMVKNSHYKEHIMRSITESGGRRRQTREKRKKSLPVRKLLELERAQHDFKNGDTNALLDIKMEPRESSRITCEKCGLKIDTAMFVEHIRQCVGGTTNHRNFLKNALMSAASLNEKLKLSHGADGKLPLSPTDLSSGKDATSTLPAVLSSNNTTTTTTTPSSTTGSITNNGSSPSVLNAIEKLIEKSFDSRSRQSAAAAAAAAAAGLHGPLPTAPIGSSILKRLGIDESVDYTKPLLDTQTMHLMKSYQQARRERSGSESSSISSSRMTPERKPDVGLLGAVNCRKEDRSPTATDRELLEVNHKDNLGDSDVENTENGDVSGTEKPSTPSAQHLPPPSPSTSSPVSSEHSHTPRSSTPRDIDKKALANSLGALSSMFDSLSNCSDTSPSGNGGSGSNKRSNSNSSGGASHHPLAALQKLCDKTETNRPGPHGGGTGGSGTAGKNVSSSPSSVTGAPSPSGSIIGLNMSGSTGGAPSTTPTSCGGTTNNNHSSVVSSSPSSTLAAFGWACNDPGFNSDSTNSGATSTSTLIKCAFCDTPFISKGAYRHHLSKVHFIKDGDSSGSSKGGSSSVGVDLSVGIPLKSTASSVTGSAGGVSPLAGGVSSAAAVAAAAAAAAAHAAAAAAAVGNKSPPAFDESPHSKFLKYTELAKQLSSKYV